MDYTLLQQANFFGGITDLVKEFTEKSHQLGKKLDHLTAQKSSQYFCEQEMVTLRRKWLMTNHLVQQQIEKVKESSHRYNQTSSSPSKHFKKDMMREQKALIDIKKLTCCHWQIQTWEEIPAKCKDKTEHFVLLVDMILGKWFACTWILERKTKKFFCLWKLLLMFKTYCRWNQCGFSKDPVQETLGSSLLNGFHACAIF